MLFMNIDKAILRVQYIVSRVMTWDETRALYSEGPYFQCRSWYFIYWKIIFTFFLGHSIVHAEIAVSDSSQKVPSYTPESIIYKNPAVSPLKPHDVTKCHYINTRTNKDGILTGNRFLEKTINSYKTFVRTPKEM